MITVDDAITLVGESRKCACLDCEAAKVLVKEIFELRERIRIAESVRDDARRVSQQYLDEKRELQARELQTLERLAKLQLEKVTNG